MKTRARVSLTRVLWIVSVVSTVTLDPSAWAENQAVLPGKKGVEAETEPVLHTTHLRLDEVLTYAHEHSPALQAAWHRLLAARERPVQASALDDPMFTYEGFNIPENFDLSRTDNTILKLSQKFPFPGKREIRGEIAQHEAAGMEEEVRKAEVTLRAAVWSAYYDLWLTHQNLQIYTRDRALLAQFATIAEKKYAVGQVSQPDVLRAQVELTRLSTRITTETLKRTETQATLNRLLGLPSEILLGTLQDAPNPAMKLSLPELTAIALKNIGFFSFSECLFIRV
jgi:outer membrane protein TolC